MRKRILYTESTKIKEEIFDMKKVCAFLLCLVMIASMLCGCSGQAEKENSQTAGEGETEKTEEGDSQSQADNTPAEIKKVVLTYATPGAQAPDMEEVQEYINEISREKIGVEVEFLPISVFELGSTVPTKVISGERIDIFMMAFTGTKIYEDMNLLLPLNDYLNETTAPYLYANSGAGGTYDDRKDTVYSVTFPFVEPANGGFMISKSDLEAAGFAGQYKDYDKITLDDLGEIFAKIKEVYPDKYPCGVVGSAPRAGFAVICDALGDTVNSGVLIGLDSTEVVNYYTSEPYVDYLEHMRDWYLKGYIPKDAATTDIGLTDYLKEGIISGYFNSFKDYSLTLTTGDEYVYLQFMEYYNTTQAPAAGMYFGVPVTAEEPEAAVRFIDLLFSSPELANVITWGIEGKHYVTKEDEMGKYITYPEGIDASNSGYPYGYGFYCNLALDDEVYQTMGPADSNVLTRKEIAERAEGRDTQGLGCIYDSSAWTTQLQIIDNVVAQYKASLECGASDLDTVYPEFISALEANGINEIIADKQAYLDSWLAR